LSTKEILYREIENASPQALEDVLAYLRQLNSGNRVAGEKNSEKIAKHIGVLNDSDAQELRTIINRELKTG
jgi:hypothetical protein